MRAVRVGTRVGVHQAIFQYPIDKDCELAGRGRYGFCFADAKDGKPLWSFPTNQIWKASPMTYMFDNRQYVAVAAGQNIIAFGLP